MSVQKTGLNVLINRMKRRQSLNTVEDQDLVRDLDESLRTNRRDYQLPWNLKKATLRVFSQVLEYPVPADYDELAYIDTAKDESYYPARARFKFTSLQQFYENLDYRNDLAEIRDGNTTFLGVRYRAGVGSTSLNTAEDDDDWSVSGDATAVTEDTVNFKKGSGSMRIDITNSTDLATIKNTFTSFIDSNYKQKYHFKWVYLDAVPTSISLRLNVDSSNYLETTGITTQFSGQPFVADAWNLVAHDLNLATATGTITAVSSTWTYEEIDLIEAGTGTYYIDESNLRQWELLDFWYYSKYSIKTVSASLADQEYFMDSSEVYSTDSALAIDSEWADLIMYRGMMIALADKKEGGDFKFAEDMYMDALNELELAYPSMKPLIITTRYRMQNDHTGPSIGNLN